MRPSEAQVSGHPTTVLRSGGVGYARLYEPIVEEGLRASPALWAGGRSQGPGGREGWGGRSGSVQVMLAVLLQCRATAQGGPPAGTALPSHLPS